MSSIIDALKKSDKTRSTDSGRNINQIKFGDEPPQKSRRGFWLLVIFLLFIASLVFAWQQDWHHAVVNQAKIWLGHQPNGQFVAVENNVNSSDKTNETTPNKVADKSPSQVNEQDGKLTPPNANEVKAKTLAAEQSKNTVETDASTERQAQLEVISSRNTTSVENNSDLTDELDLQADKNIPIEPTETNRKTEGTTAKDQLKIADSKQDIEPSLKQEYLLIHQIDFEIRKNIPPIRLNVHIYDPEPENRMVILNGVKYAMGDIIEDLVTVEAISKDGVVLAFEGTKFLIPK